MTVRLDSKFSEQTNTCEFRKAVNLAYSQGGLKLEIIEGGVILSEYGTRNMITVGSQLSEHSATKGCLDNR